MILVCPRCGEAFAPARHNQRFCSADCQVGHNKALYRQRRRAARREPDAKEESCSP